LKNVGEKTASSTNIAAKNWISDCRKLKLDACLSPCTSINSKWITNLNTSSSLLKLLQETPGNTMEAIGIGNNFLSTTKMAQQLKERMEKWECKIKKRLPNKRNGF
jgi:hypothetical protein